MPRGLRGKTAIVTGGASGIGRGIATALAGHGTRVILWDRDFAPLATDPLPFDPLAQREVDVADSASVFEAFGTDASEAGGIDILVNNAGINGPIAPVWEYPLDAWDRVLATNLSGVFHGCRAALPHMRTRGSGRILNIASMAGKEGVEYLSGYSAAKAGVIGFTKAVAKEVAQDGVTVNCIAPAMVETGLAAEWTADHMARMKAKIPMGRFLEVTEVADLACWILSDEASFTTGFTFDLSGGRATY